jgi:predicted short-subunit dehydrogenase-like oxidoreductase (DUF2520 family)
MDSTVTDPAITPARISVAGPGRLGRVLTAALGQAGYEVAGPFGRDEPVLRADAVLLCVPDAEIPAAAAAVAGAAPLVGHTSGATPLTPLTALAPAGSEHFGLHPLQTFSGDEGPRHLLGVGCAVAGSSPAALDSARELALSLGMVPFALADEDRAAYHAAASMASNFLVTLEEAAEELAGGAGLPADQARALLAPLVRSTVENWARRGPREALTGPVARGDEETVMRQRAAVSRTAPHLLPLFDTMVDRTRSLAEVPA